MKALVLSGGGSKGAFQAGAVAQLAAKGMTFDVVRGVSVGALNGIMVALGKVGIMQQIWWMIQEDWVLKRRGLVRVGGSYGLHKIGIHPAPMGWFSNSPLERLLAEHATGTLKADFLCGVVNDRTGEYIEHKIPKGSSVSDRDRKFILASTAIPGVFDPVKIDGDWHVDGGVRVQAPISPVLSDEVEEVVIVNCSVPDKKRDSGSKDLVDVIMKAVGDMMDEIFNKDQREFHRINRIVRQAQKKGVQLLSPSGKPYKVYESLTVSTVEDLGSALDFSKHTARARFRIGVEAITRQAQSR